MGLTRWLLDVDAHVIIWKVALGWSLLTTIILLLVAILLDVFGMRLLQDDFRKWVYGVFLVGLLGGVSAWFLNVIKIDPISAAESAAPSALDRAADKAYIPPVAPSSIPPPLPPSAPYKPADFKVFVQFAGLLRREDVVALSQKLASAGWNVQGRDRGGERTTAAAGYNEVRYSSADSENAARALARAVQEANLVSKPIGVARNDSIPPRDLEVWISR
ncbi:MAG: hypothetical protein QOJ86_1481 [Bradyrhizobium sp.]|nr:hypothetical protein [Bradyrhizobium sp.]